MKRILVLLAAVTAAVAQQRGQVVVGGGSASSGSQSFSRREEQTFFSSSSRRSESARGSQQLGANVVDVPRFPQPRTTLDPWLPMPVAQNNIRSVSTRCDRTRNSMEITFEFENSFDGYLYAKGYYSRQGCRVQGTRERFAVLSLTLDGRCGTEQAGTEGVNLQYSNTIVVMNEAEWELIEMMDSAYRVHCGFTPDVTHTLQSGVTVPMIGVTDLPITVPTLPECRMKIVEGKDPRAERATSLVLGNIASMVFYLNMDGPSEGFDMFVFHCITSDGSRAKTIELIDGNGCPAQQKIIGHTVYSRGDVRQGETLSYAHFKVFKFPDVPNVYFECQCRVCVDTAKRLSAQACHPVVEGVKAAAGATRADRSREEEREESET